jgi:phosphoribosylformylglycinamidine synthase subunit PurL
MRVKDHGKVVAEIPNSALVEAAPVYNRPTVRPSYLDVVQKFDPASLPPIAPQTALFALLGSPTIASKRWVYRQYDHMVRTNTIVLAGMGAGVVRVKGTSRAIAMSVDGNGRYCYLNPRRGAMLAVAEAARNVACAGATPIGATNCLNFGNPERPEIMWQLVEAIEGIADACRALDVPITGGNVSLYNETNGEAIYPTPILGVVGVLDDASKVVSRTFKAEGDAILLFGEGFGELGGSEFLEVLHGTAKGQPPQLDLGKERALITLLTRAASAGLLQSAHDCSDGGIAVTVAECSFEAAGIGSDVDVPEHVGHVPNSVRLTATLFGESASRVVVSVKPEDVAAVLKLAGAIGVPARRIGRTGGSRLAMRVAGQDAIDCTVVEAERLWSTAIERHFAGRAA